MPSESLAAQVGAALARIRNPRLDNDLLSAGMIRDLAVTPEGRVSFTVLLSREDPATLVREAAIHQPSPIARRASRPGRSAQTSALFSCMPVLGSPTTAVSTLATSPVAVVRSVPTTIRSTWPCCMR